MGARGLFRTNEERYVHPCPRTFSTARRSGEILTEIHKGAVKKATTLMHTQAGGSKTTMTARSRAGTKGLDKGISETKARALRAW
jgi:hypothetical protein